MTLQKSKSLLWVLVVFSCLKLSSQTNWVDLESQINEDCMNCDMAEINQLLFKRCQAADSVLQVEKTSFIEVISNRYYEKDSLCTLIVSSYLNLISNYKSYRDTSLSCLTNTFEGSMKTYVYRMMYLGQTYQLIDMIRYYKSLHF